MRAGGRHSLLAAALLLAGCDGGPARADAPQGGGMAAAGVAAAYEQCLDSADGATAMMACADTAIARATAGAEPLAAFLRDLGDRRLAGDPSLARRVAVADAAARFAVGLADNGTAPVAANPPSLPSGLATRWDAVRAAHCATARPDCPARADGLLARYLAATAGTPDTGATALPPAPLSTTLPDCAALMAERADPQTLLDRLERTYPAAYADPARVDAAVAPDAVPQLARSLACHAGLTGYDAFLADQAVALFASPRHGAAAFAALDRMAAGDGPEAAFAREFASQMRDYL